jgi:CHAT domain-containing protein
VLRRDGTVTLVDLGSRAELDRLVHAFRQPLLSVLGARAPDPGAPAETVAAPESPPELRAAGLALRQAVWEPLRPVLDGVREVLIAPAGDLAFVPFHLMPDDAGHLGDTLAIGLLSTGRDLLVDVNASLPPSGASLVIAAPDYDHVPEAPSDATAPVRLALTEALRSGGISRFAPLGEALAEGRTVANQLGVAALVGAAAAKTRVLNARRPRVLHFATHGFFVPARELASGEDDLALTPLDRWIGPLADPVTCSRKPSMTGC